LRTAAPLRRGLSKAARHRAAQSTQV